MYRIVLDDRRRRLVSTLEGFWDRAVVDRFGADLGREVSRISARHPDFSSLCDARRLDVPSKGGIEGFDKIVALGPRITVGRSAVVVGSALLKRQAERVFKGTRARVFTKLARPKPGSTGRRTTTELGPVLR